MAVAYSAIVVVVRFVTDIGHSRLRDPPHNPDSDYTLDPGSLRCGVAAGHGGDEVV